MVVLLFSPSFHRTEIVSRRCVWTVGIKSLNFPLSMSIAPRSSDCVLHTTTAGRLQDLASMTEQSRSIANTSHMFSSELLARRNLWTKRHSFLKSWCQEIHDPDLWKAPLSVGGLLCILMPKKSARACCQLISWGVGNIVSIESSPELFVLLSSANSIWTSLWHNPSTSSESKGLRFSKSAVASPMSWRQGLAGRITAGATVGFQPKRA